MKDLLKVLKKEFKVKDYYLENDYDLTVSIDLENGNLVWLSFIIEDKKLFIDYSGYENNVEGINEFDYRLDFDKPLTFKEVVSIIKFLKTIDKDFLEDCEPGFLGNSFVISDDNWIIIYVDRYNS
jgi:hypothetical protein